MKARQSKGFKQLFDQQGRRLLQPIGDIPPTEYEDNYYRQLAEDAAA